MYLTMINMLRRRRSVPLGLFYEYWRDTHVGVAARLPGIDTLRIHWVDWDEGCRWPSIDGVDSEVAEHLRFEGIPEPSFVSAEDVGRFGAAMAPLMRDEINIFERTIGFRSLGGNTATFKQDGEVAPNGPLPGFRYMLFLRQRTGREWSFRDGVRELAASLAMSVEVSKCRMHLLEPYDDTEVFLDAGVDAVSHGLALADQYQAVLEVGFDDMTAQDTFHASSIWTKGSAHLQRVCAAVHPYRIMRTYTPKLDGRLTLSGLRGAAVVDQIRAVGAMNQVDDETMALFGAVGSAVETQL